MPKAFTDREKEVIRRRLLEHGYRQFSAYGLGKTNVEEIAGAAGISKGAFYGFYASKEALFMAVIENAEVRLRQEIMAVINLPGPSPRARLFAALKKAFGLFDEMPILRSLTGPDFDVLFRRMPPEILQAHLDADRVFIQELVDHCRTAGIPIRAQPEEITGLLYPLVLAVLHKEDLGPAAFGGNVDVLLELIAAFCLGEVHLRSAAPNPGVAESQEEDKNMNLSIETDNLGKRYGDVKAVERLSLRVAEGEIYAFLGLNGAGKTTTIRMLLGMIRPTSGSARVLQTQVRMGSREPWASVGYLVETPHAYPELTVRENLEVTRRLHPGTPRASADRILERMGLASYADRRAGNLSQGNAQRLGLAKALLHAPRLLFLDEPANGLDPAGIVEIRELLLELTHEQGVTVFMSSHILAEVARLAQRIGIIHEGRLIQELNIDELERNRSRRLVLRTREPQAAMQTLITAGQPAALLPDGLIELKGASSVDRPEDINRLLVEAGTSPLHLVVEEEELEQYFLRLVGVNGVQQNA